MSRTVDQLIQMARTVIDASTTPGDDRAERLTRALADRLELPPEAAWRRIVSLAKLRHSMDPETFTFGATA